MPETSKCYIRLNNITHHLSPCPSVRPSANPPLHLSSARALNYLTRWLKVNLKCVLSTGPKGITRRQLAETNDKSPRGAGADDEKRRRKVKKPTWELVNHHNHNLNNHLRVACLIEAHKTVMIACAAQPVHANLLSSLPNERAQRKRGRR